MSPYHSFVRVYQEAEAFLETPLSRFDRAYDAHFKTDLSFLEPLMSHVHNGRGKRLRPILHFLIQGLLTDSVDENVRTAVILELLHTATLIHDDVVDEAPMRRGLDTVNARWGNKVAVLTGDYLFSNILSLGVDAGGDGIISVIARVAKQVGTGELRQTLITGTSLPDVHSYYQNIEDKTASLYAAAAELGGMTVQASAADQQRLMAFGRLFGLVFQIRDDILDYTGDDRILGKPVLQDARDGKATLPLILAAHDADTETLKTIETALARCDEQGAQWIQSFVARHNGIALAQSVAVERAKEAVKLLEYYTPSRYKTLLTDLVLADLERQQ